MAFSVFKVFFPPWFYDFYELFAKEAIARLGGRFALLPLPPFCILECSLCHLRESLLVGKHQLRKGCSSSIQLSCLGHFLPHFLSSLFSLEIKSLVMNTVLLQGGAIALHLGLPELIDEIYIFLIYFLTIIFN